MQDGPRLMRYESRVARDGSAACCDEHQNQDASLHSESVLQSDSGWVAVLPGGRKSSCSSFAVEKKTDAAFPKATRVMMISNQAMICKGCSVFFDDITSPPVARRYVDFILNDGERLVDLHTFLTSHNVNYTRIGFIS